VVRLTVRVTPRSGANEVAGWRGAELCVRVTSAPEGGKANDAVVRVIADALGVAKSRVAVVRGHTSRVKSLAIEGVEESDLNRVFGSPGDTLW